MDLADSLAGDVLVLDGGLSTLLTAAGHDLSDELWSARLLITDPDAIREAHLAYFRAGAGVAITSSYQVTFEGFARKGLTTEETAGLLRTSVDLARRAAADVEGSPLVAASVGPYGAMLADGSEYRGRYGVTRRRLADFHRARIEVLVDAGPDVLAVETIPDVDEAEAILDVIAGQGFPAWLSFSVRGTRTCAGQPLEEAFAVAAGVDEVIAVGVNCCEPADADEAVAIAREVTGKPVVVYPNSGEKWDAEARRWRGSATFDPARVAGWVDAGARLIGGCCQVGPDLIADLAVLLATPPSRLG